MPTVSINRDLLFEALGRIYTDDEFQELCFEFGLELDEVTTEKQMLLKEQGVEAVAGGVAGTEALSEDVLYRVDIPANRYDLLCLEGLANGLLVFQGKIPPPQFTVEKAEDVYSLHLTASTAQIRPYAVAAVLRGVTFNQHSYKSFIDLQDKLHQNICRKRSLVAIGTHDLDTVRGPFVYDALPPADISFRALNQPAVATAPQLMAQYATHPQLKQYLGIIKDSPVYPVIKDRDGVVLSMPPIINGDHSKITLNTKNVLIECTATDLTKAIVVLDTLVCMFSQYCSKKHSVQQCKVYAPDGTYQLYPRLRCRTEHLTLDKANQYIGIQESAESVASLLSRMCLPTEVVDAARLRVRVPPLRHDVIHAADIYEDVAIAYGYNKIERRPCHVVTVGSQVPLNKLTEQLRQECAHAGFTEALTFSLGTTLRIGDHIGILGVDLTHDLNFARHIEDKAKLASKKLGVLNKCSREDISSKLGSPLEREPAVHISNPKTLEFQVARTRLLPGLLKTLAANKRMPLPFRLFEISDVVIKDPTQTEVGARNERRLCAVYCGRSGGFQLVHGLLDRVMQLLEVPWDKEAGYHIRQSEDPAYFPGRCASVVVRGRAVGSLGVLHPTVLAAFDLTNPCSALEFTIEPFL